MQVLTTRLHPPPQAPRTALTLVTANEYVIVRVALTTLQQAEVGAAINRFLTRERGDDIITLQNDTFPSALPLCVENWALLRNYHGMAGHIDDATPSNAAKRAADSQAQHLHDADSTCAAELEAEAGASCSPAHALQPLLWRQKRQAALAAAFWAPSGGRGDSAAGDRAHTLRAGLVLPPLPALERGHDVCKVDVDDDGNTICIIVPLEHTSFTLSGIAALLLLLWRLNELISSGHTQIAVWAPVTALLVLPFLWLALRTAPIRRSLIVGAREWHQRNVHTLYLLGALVRSCGGGGPHQDWHGSTRALVGAKVRNARLSS